MFEKLYEKLYNEMKRLEEKYESIVPKDEKNLNELNDILTTILINGIEAELKVDPNNIDVKKQMLSIKLLNLITYGRVISLALLDLPNEEFIKYEENIELALETFKVSAEVLQEYIVEGDTND